MVEQLFIETLKKSKLRKTSDRMTLFQVLENQKAPCSISDLVRLTSNDMDTTTVYRNLEVFEKLGIVYRLYSGWKYKIELSDKFSSHHHHMTCDNCHEVISFKESSRFNDELLRLEQEYGFKAKSHSLELIGICSQCSRATSYA